MVYAKSASALYSMTPQNKICTITLWHTVQDSAKRYRTGTHCQKHGKGTLPGNINRWQSIRRFICTQTPGNF